jgi:hypothetical protein
VDDPEALFALITSFLATCTNPALLEYGEELVPLKAGEYALEVRSAKLWVDVWPGNRSVSRRILSAQGAGSGTLDCVIQRFGGAPGKLTFLDSGKPQTAHRKLSGARQNFGEQFRRMLYRQFPGWEIEILSAAMDLQRSFSPLFPRARLVRGAQTIAAMACPEPANEHALLTFALLWFDYVKARRTAHTNVRLCLFVPETCGCLTANRFAWLDSLSLAVQLFRFNQYGSAGQVDPQDLGNLDSRVLLPSEPVRKLRPGNERNEQALELAVRANPTIIESGLRDAPLHSQVITFGATDRDIVDLLGITYDGRLVILELKAETDIHLPIQALDYWMRILWHIRRNELTHLFPGIALRSEAPMLRLVAPALAFHSTSASILKHFSPEIDVERTGINSDWSAKLKVVLRLAKGEAPQSHGGTYGGAGFPGN